MGVYKGLNQIRPIIKQIQQIKSFEKSFRNSLQLTHFAFSKIRSNNFDLELF